MLSCSAGHRIGIPGSEIYFYIFIKLITLEILTNPKIQSTDIVDIDLEDWSLPCCSEGQYAGEAILSREEGGKGHVKTDPEERPKRPQRF